MTPLKVTPIMVSNPEQLLKICPMTGYAPHAV